MALKQLIIPPEADGMRIDLVIKRYLPELSDITVRSAFSHRDVKLDRLRVQQNTRVSEGQQLSVYYMANIPEEALEIVYEDDDILLVNKRAGISVEQDKGSGVSLTELCRRHTLTADPEASFPAACHRLDIKTSGICVFAKNADAFDILNDVFRRRSLEKYYECIVRGMMKPPSAECHAFLLKDPEQARVSIYDHPVTGSKPIVTAYETLENGPVSRLRVHLITGRTHQIRAHLAALGHPILGDDVYGDRSFNRSYKARSLRLCAVSLTLDTQGRLPALDGVKFSISPPF